LGNGGGVGRIPCGQLALELGDPAKQLGKLLQRDHLAFGLAVRLSGASKPFFPIRNMVHHSGLGGDGDMVAKLQVAGEAGLAGEDDIVAQFGAARDTHLRDHQAMLAYGDVVPDLHQVVDLRPLADDRWSQRPPVNGHVGPNFHIVSNDYMPNLRHLSVNPVIEHVTKTVGPDNGPAMDADPMADLGVGIKRDRGTQVDVITQTAAGADVISGLEHRSRADPRLGFHHTIGPDMGGGIHLRFRRDNRGRMDTRLEDRLREEQVHHLGKGDPGVLNPEQHLARRGERPIDNDRRGRALLGAGEIVLILGERQVSRLGAISRSKPLDHQARITGDFGVQKFGNLSGGKRHILLAWPTVLTIEHAGPSSISTFGLTGVAECPSMTHKLLNQIDFMKYVNLPAGFSVFLAVILLPCAQAGDWPQWRGAQRDGRSSDTGLLQEWPEGGPKLAWKANGLGKGYSGIAVVGDRLYTLGDLSGSSSLLALNADGGKVLWTAKVGADGAPGWGGFAGPRCTPTVDGDMVLAVDQWGQLVCVKAADGREVWRKHFEKDFGGHRPEWGFSESPLVDGDRVVCTPGGDKGAMVALNKKTGEVIWQAKDFTDGAQYSSIVAAEIGGVRQYIQLTMENVAGIAAKDGSLLWKARRKGSTAVIPTPIVDGDLVYVSSGYNIGSHLFRVAATDGKFSATPIFANRTIANQHGGVVKVGDCLYGYCDSKGLTCQDFKTGNLLWNNKEKVKKGAVSYADGRLYCREEDNGNLVLVEAVPTGFSEKGRFNQPDRAKEKAWPHPTIANGKLYVRDQDVLLCYDVKTR